MSTAGSPSRRRTAALLVRLLIPGLLVMVLTESHAARTVNPIHIVFALDVSDSNPKVDQGIAYVSKTVPGKHGGSSDDKQSLVVFGKAAAVEIAPASSLSMATIESEVERGETNLERALSMSLAMIPDGDAGRILLISEGNQTDGDVSRILTTLKSRRVAVDVLPVEYSYEREVWLDRLELPQHVALGEAYDATIHLTSTVDGKAMLTLNENGRRIARQSIDYKAGRNRFTLPFTVDSIGYHEYIATLEVHRIWDSLTQNNTALNSLFVDGERKVLLVTEEWGDRNSWESFADVVSKSRSTLQVVNRTALSVDAKKLASNDVIVFGDVPRHELTDKQLRAVREAVEQHGVGFLMFGAVNSFGPGGYHKTPIEEILPVSCDPSISERSRAAVIVILDLTSSYDGGARDRDLLSNLLQSMGATDELGVVIRRKGEDRFLFPLTSVANSKDLQAEIDAARFDRIASFQDTMDMALVELLNRDIPTRHVLIVSDGTPRGPSTGLLQQYQQAGVTVSAIAIYPPSGMDHSSMSRTVQTTGGQYQHATHPNQLPSIIDRELRFLNRRALRQRTFTPTFGDQSAVSMHLEEIPSLQGYISTSCKQGAVIQALQVPVAARFSTSPEPLLATWQHGFGKTAAFMSNFDSNWGQLWQQWTHFPQFVDQLLNELGRPKNLRVSAEVSQDVATIRIHDLRAGDAQLQVEVSVSGPDQRTETISLMRVAPQRYEGRVPLWGHGRYQIVATAAQDARHESVFSEFSHVVTYSPELLQLTSNKQALQEIAMATGGRILGGDPVKDAVYSGDIRTVKYVPQGSFDWMLILLALLVPVNVLLQRLWHDVELAHEQWNAPPVPSPTIQALFKTKEWVSNALSTKGTARMLIQIWAPPPVRHVSTPATVTPETPPDASHSSDSANTTFEKLLAMKRRQNEHS